MFNSSISNIAATSSTQSLAWLTSFHRYSEYSAEAVALISNTILVYLILTEKKKEYRDYRRVLLLNCFVDYICTAVGILLQPHFEILDGQWIYIISEPLIYFPKGAQLLIGGWYGFSNSFGITTIPIQFFFRKRLICNDEKLSIRALCKWTTISFISSCACGIVFFLCFYVSRNTPFNYQPLIDNGLVGSNEYNHLMNAEMISIPMILIIIMAAASNITTFYLVLRFSFQIYKKLNDLHADMSSKTQRLQRSFNLMLAVQTFSAFAIGVIPMMILLFIMATRMNIVGAGSIISIFLSCIPVVNPVCTLILVSQFRRRFLNLVRIGPMQTTSNIDQETNKHPTLILRSI